MKYTDCKFEGVKSTPLMEFNQLSVEYHFWIIMFGSLNNAEKVSIIIMFNPSRTSSIYI
jgi:hypothetical protein